MPAIRLRSLLAGDAMYFDVASAANSRTFATRTTHCDLRSVSAAILGADDAIVSTASLMIGVAASSAPTLSVLVAGAAGLVAGALSMAAGEYVSVSSQHDLEEADVRLEKRQHAANPNEELIELEQIYRNRGLDAELAKKVAEQLTKHDRLGAHLRDELGIVEATRARPLQAALVSAASFASVASLAGLGALGGHAGGAPMARAALRVTIGGGLAMAITALIGACLARRSRELN